MRAILFDLDGTLLPMDLETFSNGYFTLLTKKAAERSYAPKELMDGVWQGTKAMMKNDGAMPNRQRFWQTFADLFGQQAYGDEALFDSFYENEFQEAIRFASPLPETAKRAVAAARTVADRVILATNPIFPLVGVATRLGWLGLQPSDFDYVTTYENASYCKPNQAYYQQVLDCCKLQPENCLMAGNDVDEDILPAAAIGMKTYLVNDCLINRSGSPVSCASGTLSDFADALANGKAF